MSLKSKAEQAGIEYIDKGNGHIQLKGQLLVNYYPNSKTKTAYVAGTTKGLRHVSEDEVIRMCFEVPNTGKQQKRKVSYRGDRNKLLKKDPRCYWCRCNLTLETSTLDHKVPLSKGGLNNFNNYVLACQPCNSLRGNEMPELRKADA